MMKVSQRNLDDVNTAQASTNQAKQSPQQLQVREKRFYYRVTIPFTRMSLLVKAPYPIYDWFRSLF